MFERIMYLLGTLLMILCADTFRKQLRLERIEVDLRKKELETNPYRGLATR